MESAKAVVLNRYPDVIAPLVASIRELEPEADVLIVADGHDESYGFEHIRIDARPFVFARNANAGIEAAGQADVVLINDDCRLLQPATFRRLQMWGRSHPRIGILSPLIRGTAGTPWQREHERHRWNGDRMKHEEKYGPCFICVWMRREMINEIGPMAGTERYGGDDIEYCDRARRAGWLTSVTSSVTVQHGDGTPMGERGKAWSLSFVRREAEA